ncbi:hypothetical protein [Methylomonas sp. DH-1]|uniref:hypothetical protein n=1 Tax=Methylomonas sp. (strain DH-1) TaxID=1727196 RepID=UPI0007C96B5C|nr:hypothetical protein [Methylomonas sp. DH-1]ANE56761.1 hypothetical protein AYM39_17310 [Methylomonas sp. DH-1]
MFEQSDQKLSAWVGTVAADAKISFEPPGTAAAEPTVVLYLLDFKRLTSTPAARSPQPQLLLNYLVTVQAADQAAAHKLLGTLVAAVVQQTEFEFELAPPPLETWLAFAAKPAPAFTIKLPVALPVTERTPPRIKAPPQVRMGPVATFSGRLLGPGEIPLADTDVELVAAGRYTRTDAAGNFSFAGIDPNQHKRGYLIRAKRHELLVDTANPTQDPVVIHFEQLEI